MWNGTANDGSLVVKGRHSVAFNGVEITFIGQANQFDEFTYDPVKGSAGGVALAIKRPQDIAAASQLLVSANPGNKSQVLIDAKLSVSAEAGTSALPSIRDVFSNRPSAIAATEFLNGGSVARIPANVSSIDLLSLKKQSQAQFGLSETDLGNASTLKLKYQITDANGSTTSETVTFNIDHNAVKGFNGDWTNADQIADLLNRGIVRGTLASTNASCVDRNRRIFVRFEGYLNFSLTDGNFTSATLARSVVVISPAWFLKASIAASEIQIFSREGRHIAGTTPDDAKIAEYQAAREARERLQCQCGLCW